MNTQGRKMGYYCNGGGVNTKSFVDGIFKTLNEQIVKDSIEQKLKSIEHHKDTLQDLEESNIPQLSKKVLMDILIDKIVVLKDEVKSLIDKY